MQDKVLQIKEDRTYPWPLLAWQRQEIGQAVAVQVVVGGD